MIDTNKHHFSSGEKFIVALAVVSFAVVALMCTVTTKFLAFNETRSGFRVWDPAFQIFDPVQLNWPIFTITYIAIAVGLVFALNSAAKILQTNFTIILILTLRIISMYLVPLDPPSEIIPLIDPFLTSTFYDDQVLIRDLFFSGHTASMVLLALLVDNKVISRVLWGLSVVIGSMLILQHVHYTIDVLAAYIFAWLAYMIGTWMRDTVMLYVRLYSLSLQRKFRYTS